MKTLNEKLTFARTEMTFNNKERTSNVQNDMQLQTLFARLAKDVKIKCSHIEKVYKSHFTKHCICNVREAIKLKFVFALSEMNLNYKVCNMLHVWRGLKLSQCKETTSTMTLVLCQP